MRKKIMIIVNIGLETPIKTKLCYEATINMPSLDLYKDGYSGHDSIDP